MRTFSSNPLRSLLYLLAIGSNFRLTIITVDGFTFVIFTPPLMFPKKGFILYYYDILLFIFIYILKPWSAPEGSSGFQEAFGDFW